jgi:hypothetical protein
VTVSADDPLLANQEHTRHPQPISPQRTDSVPAAEPRGCCGHQTPAPDSRPEELTGAASPEAERSIEVAGRIRLGKLAGSREHRRRPERRRRPLREIPSKTTIFFLVAGPSIVPGRTDCPPEIVDVAATALAHMGIVADDLDGKPRGLGPRVCGPE